MAAEELWFRTSGKPYVGPEPPFFNPAEFDWARFVTSNWPVIREEMKIMIEENQNQILKPYFEDSIQFPPKNWKTESFFFWTKANRVMIKMFPKTYDIIKQVPGLVSASVNLLEPGSKIKAHYGDTNAIFRCHLGLKIPEGLPTCGFRVGNETRSWEEQKFLIFLDAYEHEAFNNSSEKRYILLLDVLRPEFRNRKYYIATQVLGSLTLYEITNGFPALRSWFVKTTTTTKNFLIFFTRLYWWLFLALQRNIHSTHLK